MIERKEKWIVNLEGMTFPIHRYFVYLQTLQVYILLISAFIYWQLLIDTACDNDEANDEDDNDGSGLRLRHHKDNDDDDDHSANTDNDNDNQTSSTCGDER